MNWIKKHKKLCIFIVIAIAVVVAVIFGKVKAGKENQTDTRETETVERRTLMKSVSSTGQFTSAGEEKISSDTIGVKVLAVNVEVGDTVAAGDTICVLDTEDLNKRLSDAQQSLQDTQTQVDRTKNSAQRSLDKAKKDRDAGIKQVDDNIADAKTNWDNAEKTYTSSAEAYNSAVKDAEKITDQKSQAYISAQNQVNTTKQKMEADRATADSLKKQYDTQVSNRQDSIDSLNEAYQSQEDAYNDTMDGTKDATKTQQETIDDLNKQIAGAVVKATTSGLVTAVNVAVGDDYNGSIIAKVENVDSFEVTTEIGEYDINDVQVGQEVVIKTNATGDEELHGVVKKVSPIATGNSSGDIGGGLGFDVQSMLEQSGMSGTSSGGNDVTFTVNISVDTQSDKLRIGMTAKVNIILQKNEDVLSVPYNVVQTDKKGNSFVEKVVGKNEDGTYKTKKVTVEKGIESDYYTELINSGLKEGEKLLLPQSEKKQNLEDMIQNSSSMGGV